MNKRMKEESLVDRLANVKAALLLGLLASVISLYVLVPYSWGYGDAREPVVYWMYHGYTELENGEWGFGFVVLPAALVMLWLTRERYKGLEVKPAGTGLGVIVFALLCYMAGFKANEKYIGYFSGHMLIAGMP